MNYFKKNNNHLECKRCNNEKQYVCITKEGSNACSFSQNPLKIKESINNILK